MPQADESFAEKSWLVRKLPQGNRARLGLAAFVLALVVGALVWIERERIADDFIAGQLADLGIPARYEVVSIGPRRQVLRNVVVGDPARPDLTIELVELRLRYRIGMPQIASLKLVRPRLQGKIGPDGLSFGALDKVIFAEREAPPQLPDIDLKLVDGQGRIATDYGPLLFAAAGSGGLDDGFRGSLVASGSRWTNGDCTAGPARLTGVIAVDDGKPSLRGPLHLARVACAASEFSLDALEMQLAMEVGRDLSSLSGKGAVKTGKLAQGTVRSQGLNGDLTLRATDGIVSSRFDLAARSVQSQQLMLATLGAVGEVTLRGESGRIEASGKLHGNELRLGSGVDQSLQQAQANSAGTLAESLLAKFRGAVAREAKGSVLNAEFLLRSKQGTVSLVMPRAEWRGGSGAQLVALSQLQLALKGDSIEQISGNFLTGGKDLPQINGRIQRAAGGMPVLRLAMEPYASGNSRLALPVLVVSQVDEGDFALTGKMVASGAIPTGSVEDAEFPLTGGWDSRGGAWLWRRCTDFRFARLTISELELEGSRARICPNGRAPILALDRRGTRFSARMDAHDWAGRLAGEPARIRFESARFSSRTGFAAEDIELAYGTADSRSRFALGKVATSPGALAAGNFQAGEFALGPVPMDISEASGRWSFVNGVLSVAEGQFRVSDRQGSARFEPLVARDAVLEFADGRIEALAALRHPASDTIVTEVVIEHDLASAVGHASLAVDALRFDKQLQPADLSGLALGIVALADGTLNGSGRIDWRGSDVVSTGSITTDDFDFAAEFGPVNGVSGTVRFSDLVALTTAPDQKLKIASINPGIEVFDGELTFELRDGQFLSLKHGIWPFVGGTLILRPVQLNLKVPEERRYVIEIVGADAALFVQQMDLGNISATGTFDGSFPLVFDENGDGRIEDGQLISRPPGGNLSYVGELTYEDLSAMGNYAFQTLRSLDYRKMTVVMNGLLSGEIITQLKFDGVRQGKDASRNIFTKQLAKLPIEFRINIRAQFHQLLTSFKSLYDPSFLRDPRDLGLLTSDGTRFIRPDNEEPVPGDEPAIQRQESEQMP